GVEVVLARKAELYDIGNLATVLRMAVGDKTGGERSVLLLDEVVERGVNASASDVLERCRKADRSWRELGKAPRPHRPERRVHIFGRDDADGPRGFEDDPGVHRREGREWGALADQKCMRPGPLGERIGRDKGDSVVCH